MNSIRGGLKSTEVGNVKEKGTTKLKVDVKPKKKKGRKPKLSVKQKEEVVNLYLEGYSFKDISDYYRVSEMTVYRIVNGYIKENFSGESIEEVFERVKEKVWS